MWILLVLWFTGHRRAVVRVVSAWTAVMAACLTIAAPGQLYLQSVAPDSPAVYPVPAWPWLLAVVACPIILAASVWVLWRTRKVRNDA